MTNKREMLSAAPDWGEPSKAPRPLRVLIADDERDTVVTLMVLFREEGHDVRGVHSGRNAMASVINFDPDAVVLDINMPDMSGWQVAQTIRARQRSKRPLLIGISGHYKTGADRVLAQLNGFDHYLIKPYAPAELLKLLAPLSNSPERRSEA
jgi:DNA-binding response OmpR family regulator